MKFLKKYSKYENAIIFTSLEYCFIKRELKNIDEDLLDQLV